MRRLGTTIALTIAIVATCAMAQDTHPFSVNDMLAMKRISDPQVSPDGKSVLFSLRTTDLEKNKGSLDLWLVGIDGTGLRQLTTNPATDAEARWSPDGKWIYFTSTRSGSSQIWKLPLDGGEAMQITKLPLDVSSVVVSPSGTHLAFSLEVFPGKSVEETSKALADTEAKKSSGKVYDQLFVRHWDSWADGRRNHVFVMPVAGGDPVDVMKAMDADSPGKPFGGADDIEFTPDGKSVVFVARDAGREEAWSTNLDLWVAPIDASAAPRNLTADNKATDGNPVFSPDGKWLAWHAMSRAGYEADRYRIMVRPWPEGAAREVAPKWDRSADSLTWSADGKTIYVQAENVGNSPIFAVDVATGNAKALFAAGTAAGFSLGKDRLVYSMDNLRSPVEIYTVTFDGKTTKQITKINEATLKAARMGEPEQFSFKGANDETVYAWIVKPIDFDPAKKYPVAFLIHGGPQGSFGNHFHYRWNPQAYAGRGYAAVMVDFHGSTGYGQAFCDAIRGDWGGKPLVDLQKGLDAALANYPWMDGNRVAALGASYGAYMVNWIAGQMPDRFRCLVTHDGNLDERMAYFDTEELWFPEWDHMGTPWDNPEGYTKHNPIDYVSKWKAPMLVIHGGKDYRIPYSQGISTFTALQRRGIPSRFLYFPDENHWVLKPANSIQWHEEVLGWLDKWTK